MPLEWLTTQNIAIAVMGFWIISLLYRERGSKKEIIEERMINSELNKDKTKLAEKAITVVAMYNADNSKTHEDHRDILKILRKLDK